MFYKSTIGFLSLLLLLSCNSEYKFILNSPAKITINQNFTISVTEKNGNPIDSVQYSIDNVKLKGTGLEAIAETTNYKLGKHTITAVLFFEGKTEKISNIIYIMADEAPAIYDYKIVNTYPHDPKAYTQGLEYYNGFLYEGTGRNGTSWIRKVELTTGKVLQQADLDEKYFGEGITIFNDKLLQLTWQSGVGFVYDLATFKNEKEFKYTKSREGWGLTHDGNKIFKSDGTERIWLLNPDTLVEESYIEAYTDTQKVEKLNELEFVNGKIYANIWQKNSILIVDPTSGKVEGVANLNGLKDEILKVQQLDEEDEVLNGIAYDKENNRLFVTGKHWSKLYEIELFKK
ncbi:MAG: glutaminyl-peptide cyclotransferase [Lutibacter sp.]|nr:glutaminyl-peptide cyclotransferase [Lutibacter sp.]MBP9602360.1 glutaminyl-peptide cyclotransferase [Lutibacter sp.]